MAKIYYQEDCNLAALEGQTIAVIGYGSQGHAQALNAKESGCHVIIGLYEGSKFFINNLYFIFYYYIITLTIEKGAVF